MAQLIDRLFGARHKLVTLILVFIGDMGAIAGTILASVILVSFFLGIGFVPALLMVLGVTIIYVSLGGQWAVLWTDSIQAIMLIATGISIFVIGVTKLGGWTGFVGRLPPEMVSVTGTLKFGTMAGWVVEGIVIAMVYHALFVRGLSARSTRDAQLGFLYGGILCTLFYILPHALGLLGRATFGVGTEPNHVFFRLMSEGLPVLLVSFVLAGAIAGAMSTLGQRPDVGGLLPDHRPVSTAYQAGCNPGRNGDCGARRGGRKCDPGRPVRLCPAHDD